jgi:sec-independent protein translocase protein TatA
MKDAQRSCDRNHYGDLFMPITIASIMNLMGPDMMVILLIVLLLFGAKKLPELARGMGRAVKEFSAARGEIERELSQPSSKVASSCPLPSNGASLPNARQPVPPSMGIGLTRIEPLPTERNGWANPEVW